MQPVIRHRGLPYRNDRTFDPHTGSGVLARSVTLDGVQLPSGTAVTRDEDFDFVIATLRKPLTHGGVELPTGTALMLYRAKPASLLERAVVGAVIVPLGACYAVVVGAVELATGDWKPWRRDSARGPGVRMTACLPGDEIPRRTVRFYDDGSIGHSPE